MERTGSDVTAATRFGDAPPSAASGVGESQTYMMISDSFSEKEVREALAPSHSGLVSASIASVPSSPASSATLTHSSSLSLSSSYSTSSNEGSPIIAHQEPNQPRSDTATTTNNNNIADQEARSASASDPIRQGGEKVTVRGGGHGGDGLGGVGELVVPYVYAKPSDSRQIIQRSKRKYEKSNAQLRGRNYPSGKKACLIKTEK